MGYFIVLFFQFFYRLKTFQINLEKKEEAKRPGLIS